MVERFFSISATATATNSSNFVGGDESDPMTLLSGPPSCGKTSLLFQYAFNLASLHLDSDFDLQAYVVFLCNRRRFEAKPPFLAQGIDSSSHFFTRIQIKYVDDDEAIKKYFSAFHLLHPFPLAVVVDDFGDFFHERICQQRYNNPRGRDLAMVRVLALCQTAITHANKTAPCKLLLSDTHHGETPRLLFIYKRWVSSIFTIQGHASGSFLLTSSIHVNGSGIMKRTAKYNVALQNLVLEGFIEDT